MCSYEVLFIEDGIYYIRYYVSSEGKGIDMKLNREEFMQFIKGKVEI